MIDFFAHIGLAVIGAVTLLVAFALVLLVLLYIAMPMPEMPCYANS